LISIALKWFFLKELFEDIIVLAKRSLHNFKYLYC
jgi:hypothetical protein